tara:strand:- start:1938 stop:2141 length:204 start_codon:yes stop_codon:yes gene_type:complete
VGWGFGFVFELVDESCGCEGFGFGFDDGGSRGVDSFDSFLSLFEGFGFEGSGEFMERKLMKVTEVER